MTKPTEAMVEAAAEAAYLNNRAGSTPWADLSERHKQDWRKKVTPILTAALALQPVAERAKVIEECAKVAQSHKGSYAKRQNYKAIMRSASPEAREEIRAEERGEDIASDIIAAAIRALAPPAPPPAEAVPGATDPA